MDKSWESFFKSIEEKDYYHSLLSFLDDEYSHKTIYPKKELLFNAFQLTNVNNIKVVILGQDPYHNPNQAMGLSFSVPKGEVLPPSLQNIFKEIENDLKIKMTKNGDLSYLAKQGVFLVNAYLTVEAHKPLSHKRSEYDLLMKDIFEYLNNLNQPIVFMLWGGFAKKYRKYLNNPNHLILESNHPSPLSANRGGWFNLHQFSKCNAYLIKHNVSPIDWKNS